MDRKSQVRMVEETPLRAMKLTSGKVVVGLAVSTKQPPGEAAVNH